MQRKVCPDFLGTSVNALSTKIHHEQENRVRPTLTLSLGAVVLCTQFIKETNFSNVIGFYF